MKELDKEYKSYEEENSKTTEDTKDYLNIIWLMIPQV